jgi:aminoglycoside phosphotransferase (APT) family kinase protein
MSFTHTITNHTIQKILAEAFPHEKVSSTELLVGGLINSNIKVEFESGREPVVLRVYRDGPEVCRKEVALIELIQSQVPVSRIVYASANTDVCAELPAFAIFAFVPGITFQQLKRSGSLEAIQQAACSVGATLAAIGKFQFPKSGRLQLNDGVEVGKPFIEGPDPIPRLLDTFLESPKCKSRAGAKLVNQLHEFCWSRSSLMPDLDSRPSLVHCDFGNRNILVREQNGRWVVASVLDWEFAMSGSPLLDVGHFLRYEKFDEPLREPHFSQAFLENGGNLPQSWREIVRLIDLTALVECLTHDELPSDVESELLALIRATLVN